MSIAMFEMSLANTRETNKERGKEQQKNLSMLNMHDGRERYFPSNSIWYYNLGLIDLNQTDRYRKQGI